MKKLFLIIFIFSINIFTVYWANEFNLNTPVKDAWSNYQYDLPKWNNTTWKTISWDTWPTTVVVTEDIPWAKCVPYKDKNWEALTDITNRKFKCPVEPWFGSVMQIFAGLVKYATFLAALVGVSRLAQEL